MEGPGLEGPGFTVEHIMNGQLIRVDQRANSCASAASRACWASRAGHQLELIKNSSSQTEEALLKTDNCNLLRVATTAGLWLHGGWLLR
eukprot:scaffold191512_cov18-Tisochrysis_lutea.AAC.1